MIHYHLKYFSRTGPGRINYGAVFLSAIDAMHAAGLANATRGQEPGYYGVQECRVQACIKPLEKTATPPAKARPASSRRPRFLPGAEW